MAAFGGGFGRRRTGAGELVGPRRAGPGESGGRTLAARVACTTRWVACRGDGRRAYRCPPRWRRQAPSARRRREPRVARCDCPPSRTSSFMAWSEDDSSTRRSRPRFSAAYALPAVWSPCLAITTGGTTASCAPRAEGRGIVVLENEAVRIVHRGHPFRAAGLGDFWTRQPDIKGTLAGLPPGDPVLLLTHNPDVFPEVPAACTPSLRTPMAADPLAAFPRPVGSFPIRITIRGGSRHRTRPASIRDHRRRNEHPAQFASRFLRRLSY